MKNFFKTKQKGIVKGAPSGFVISLMVHAAAFLLAGMLVVFNVVQKEEKKFVPPKAVERPKMKLKKPKVKVKKSAKPKPTTRIVTQVKRASMPDIQLPEMSGMTDGLSGGIGGFEIMPDMEEITMFGGVQTIGSDFVGTFYDFKRDRKGRKGIMDTEEFINELTRFVGGGWKTSRLARYYRSPKKLYTTSFAIPPVQSVLAPQAFGESDTEPYCFAVHYKGELVHTEDITFRFWGLGDDIMIVRVDGKIVLNAGFPRDGNNYDTDRITPHWQTSSPQSRSHWLGINLSVVGDWITLKAGEPLPMEVLIGEVPGGVFQAMLTVEVEGEEYERSPDYGGPILPIFKTAELTLDQVESIHANLDEHDACITNGPIFCDYVSKGGFPVAQAQAVEMPEAPVVETDPMQIWTSTSGKAIEAEYVALMAGQVVLKTAKGKQLKIPVEQLSPENREFIELSNPPGFNIEFSKKSSQVPPPVASPYEGEQRPLQIFDYVFGARLRQNSTKSYNHELVLEFFAIGEEVDGDNYVLLDRQQSRFVPSKENKGEFEIYGEPVRIQQAAIRAGSPMRGTKYGGFLVTVTDKRGIIIQHKASHDFLFEKLENLKKIPVGKHFNKECIRVGPPRPGPGDRNPNV